MWENDNVKMPKMPKMIGYFVAKGPPKHEMAIPGIPMTCSGVLMREMMVKLSPKQGYGLQMNSDCRLPESVCLDQDWA